MIIANSSLCCKYIDDILTTALQNRDKAIEWDLNFIPPTLSVFRNAYIKDYIRCNDISLSFHLPYSFYEIADENKLVRDNSVNVLKRHIQFASDISTSTVDAIVHVGTTKSSKVDIACEMLKELSDFANLRGVSICVENLTYGLTANPDNLKELLSIDGVKFCFDIGHADVIMKKDPNYIKVLEDNIRNCQHAHVYRTEINYTHMPFNNVCQIKDSLLVSLILQSNCKWITFELEEYQEQLLQYQLWKQYERLC